MSQDEQLAVTPGASGYFSEPSSRLDPNIFTVHDRVYTAVRARIVSTLYSYWRSKALRAPEAWSALYIAGSGASYQWSADRSSGDGKPGDLDILIAVDWERFYLHCDSSMLHTPPDQLTDMLDEDLRANLWPRTAETRFGDAVYEMTFYINRDTGPIEAIHPYAAYDLSQDRWAVRPDPHPVHPQSSEDFFATVSDVQRTQLLVSRYNVAHAKFLDAYRRAANVGAPQMVDAEAELRQIASAAGALFKDIHAARNDAFSEHGEGYASNENFRWQRAKAAGIIEPLKAMAEFSALPPAINALVDPAGLLTRRAADQAMRTGP